MHGYGVLPIDKFGKIVTLGVCESLSPGVLQTIVDRTHLSPYMYVAPYDKIREVLETAAPYEAPAGQADAAPAPAAAEAGSEEGDWMTIFEEAEKKMKGTGDDVELTSGPAKKEEDEEAAS